MEQKEQLRDYVQSQLTSGVSADEIKNQLTGAGWDEQSVKDAFDQTHKAMTPMVSQEKVDTLKGGIPQDEQGVFEATGKKRGRLKTAWLLLKQSLKILKNNKVLLKYPLMSGVLSVLLLIIFGIIILIGGDTFVYTAKDFLGDDEVYFTNIGMVLGFFYYVIAFFVIYMYNAGLAAHVLDIFKGKSGDYKSYMKLAWGKAGVLFVYSIITAVVGVIINILERNRITGYILSRIIDVLWALANLFTIPLIVEEDISAPKAIKQSAKLFKSTWGQNIGARIGFGLIVFLLYILLLIPLMFLFIFIASFLGAYAVIAVIILLVISLLAVFIVETAASQVLNVALYYFARYRQVPAAFDKELLNASFVPKKRKKK